MTTQQLWHSVFSVLVASVSLAACAGPPGLDDDLESPAVAQAALQGEGAAIQRSRGCRPPPAEVPEALAVPATECLEVQALGDGVQIYTCVAGGWVLKAPEANLLDQRGRYVGNHFLGPTWQWKDGSKIKATLSARSDAPNPAQDIPWLLLAVTTRNGEGKLADTTYIHRLHTVGGLAPPLPCTDGAVAQVPYTADYLFYHPRPACDDE